MVIYDSSGNNETIDLGSENNEGLLLASFGLQDVNSVNELPVVKRLATGATI